MTEFSLSSLIPVSDFILDNSRRATLERINELPESQGRGGMTIDGYSDPVELKVALDIQRDRIVCDFDGTSGPDKKGINICNISQPI